MVTWEMTITKDNYKPFLLGKGSENPASIKKKKEKSIISQPRSFGVELDSDATSVVVTTFSSKITEPWKITAGCSCIRESVPLLQ